MQLRPATRTQTKIRIGLSGASGSGKTYSALLLASGMTTWDKIALIDTENGRGDLYSHLGEYQVLRLEAPFAPERFIEAIKTCEKAGVEVIIIDSVSHEWEGLGGCLESNDILAQSKFKGNTWAAWSETTPRHHRFLEAIISSPCHIITTNRSKIDMIQEGGKVKKVGMKDIQREGYEYEFTLFFNLDRDTHMANPSKDNTELFEGKDPFKISPETGEKILGWAQQGVAYIPATEDQMKKMLTLIEETQTDKKKLKEHFGVPEGEKWEFSKAESAIASLELKKTKMPPKKPEPPKDEGGQPKPEEPPKRDPDTVGKEIKYLSDRIEQDEMQVQIADEHPTDTAQFRKAQEKMRESVKQDKERLEGLKAEYRELTGTEYKKPKAKTEAQAEEQPIPEDIPDSQLASDPEEAEAHSKRESKEEPLELTDELKITMDEFEDPKEMEKWWKNNVGMCSGAVLDYYNTRMKQLKKGEDGKGEGKSA